MILFCVRFFTYSSAQMAFWHFVNGFSDKTIQVRKWLFSPIFRHFLCVFLNMYLLDFAILRHSFTFFCKNQTFVNGLSVVRKWLVTFHLLLMYLLFIRADRGVFLMWNALNKPFLVHFSLEKRVRKWLVGRLSMAFFYLLITLLKPYDPSSSLLF